MAGVLTSLSEALASAVTQASPAVVRVEGRRGLPASGIVWSADGVVVTAQHVLEREDGLRVGLANGQAVPATLIGKDPTTDLAVLRSQAQGLQSPVWAGADTLNVGHLVLAIGRPGETVRATLGVVSALGKEWTTPAGGRLERYLQTDVTMYPGFSGGPLVDADGQVFGLNTSGLLRNTSITVPTASIRRIVDILLVHGKIRRGYIGIGSQPVRLPLALAQRLNQETAVMVINISPDSPAEKGGLSLGDVIVALGGQAVRSLDSLMTILSGSQVGEVLSARVVRGGEVRELKIQIGERP